jgi:hypothetical protein
MIENKEFTSYRQAHRGLRWPERSPKQAVPKTMHFRLRAPRQPCQLEDFLTQSATVSRLIQ